KQASVEIRHVAELGLNASPVGGGALFGETSEEQGSQETLVEAVCWLCIKMFDQAELQVVFLAVQKAFFLKKPQEHQPVDQHRRIPAQILIRGRNALNEVCKRFALCFKLAIKVFGDLLARGRIVQPLGNAQHC